MKKIFLVVLILFINHPLFSQGIFSISSNKVEYSYGEIIEISVSIFNNQDTTIIFRPECEFPISIRFKGVEIGEFASLADGCERYMSPGELETWIFKLVPSKLGIPINDGEQTIYAEGYTHHDSIKIIAPKYNGGIIEINYNYLTEKENRDSFFTSLNAEVIQRDSIIELQKISELWQIQEASIDSVVYEFHNSKHNLSYVNVFRFFELGEMFITEINDYPILKNKIDLFQNYPNPFNPTTNINYSVPKSQNVKIVIYDLLGNEVKTILNEHKIAGNYSINFNAENLSSGIYFYRLIAGENILTKKMTYIK